MHASCVLFIIERIISNLLHNNKESQLILKQMHCHNDFKCDRILAKGEDISESKIYFNINQKEIYLSY